MHERAFRVRNYECDACGHLHHANYLRYMQETAMDATIAGGYDFEDYAAIGVQWYVGQSDVQYLRPILYRDEIVIRTWIDFFRRVRARRAYEFRDASTGDLLAKASTDWICLDLEKLCPTTVPAEVIDTFRPEGAGNSQARRDSFPHIPPAPPDVFTLQRHVKWRDLDSVAHHVNNAMHVDYMEECSADFHAAHGWSMERLYRKGLAITNRRYRIEYKQPAELDDVLAISTWGTDLDTTCGGRYYAIRRAADDTLLVRAFVTWAWVDLAAWQLVPIPAEFIADCAPNFAASALVGKL